MEMWKDIPGYEGKYQVSNAGNVRSLNYMRTGQIRNLKQANDVGDYKKVQLVGDGGKVFNLFVHVLVAKCFVPGEAEGLEVNHKDFDRSNNHASNLEWTSHADNIMHSHKAGRRKIPYQGKKVRQYTKEGAFVKEYDSANLAAEESGAKESNIIACCRKKTGFKSAGGYRWEYGGE